MPDIQNKHCFCYNKKLYHFTANRDVRDSQKLEIEEVIGLQYLDKDKFVIDSETEYICINYVDYSTNPVIVTGNRTSCNFDKFSFSSRFKVATFVQAIDDGRDDDLVLI